MTTPNYAAIADELTKAAFELDTALERIDAVPVDVLDRLIDTLDLRTVDDATTLRAGLAAGSRLLYSVAVAATEAAP